MPKYNGRAMKPTLFRILFSTLSNSPKNYPAICWQAGHVNRAAFQIAVRPNDADLRPSGFATDVLADVVGDVAQYFRGCSWVDC